MATHGMKLRVSTAVALAGSVCMGGAVSAQSVCGGEVVLQCATDSADNREQITVCAHEQSYVLTRHNLASGDMYYDPPLVADAETTWFNWEEGDQALMEIGFWSTDLGEPVVLRVALPWDDVAETVADHGTFDMWLQSPEWQAHVDQTLCASDTVYADPEALWPPQRDRAPIGSFFSQDEITPYASKVGVVRVLGDTATTPGVPVYASARPSAATPVWWMLQPGDTVDVLDRRGLFWAVAIPTNGISGCVIRPRQLGKPYHGPCATGWVESSALTRIQ